MSQLVIVAVRGAAFALELHALCGSFDAAINDNNVQQDQAEKERSLPIVTSFIVPSLSIDKEHCKQTT
jgi:hypothetical protein